MPTNAAIQELAVLSTIRNHLAMIMFDPTGHVVWVNQKFAGPMGYSTEELIGMHHAKLCLPSFAASQAYGDLWKGLREGKAFQDKIVRVTRNGSILTLEASYMPVCQDGKVEAVIKIATDITERESFVQRSTSELTAMVQEMTANTDEVLASSNRIVADMTSLNRESARARDHIQSVQSIAAVVKDIADQSHLLGLNAAIEAARAGEEGRGFEVVATEIRKMARTSKESAENISAQLTEAARSFASITKQIDQVTKQMAENSMAIGELKIAYDHITATTEELASSI